ncbi:MAG: hypothetical protein Q7T34_02160, partial [Candidatus Parcubacteria bacterium]|nr:hypothetical protein [Candidatus Parcubacteria bacterium]
MKKTGLKRVLAAMQDPGGSAAVLPVVKLFKKEGKVDVKIFCGKYSYALLEREKISFVRAGDFSDKKLESQFRGFNPDLVFTANSFGFSLDKKVLRIAKKAEIPTISIIDFWSNYWLRFLKEGEKKDPRFLPDKIIVIDRIMKKEMVKEGFPGELIKVFGNPSLESLPLKKRLKRGNVLKILFISQPIRDIYGEKGYFGFDEFEVLKDFLEVIKGLKADLTVRLHPKEKTGKYDSIIGKQKIKIDQESNLDELIYDANLVLGINSIALFRASLAGIPVISYQPGLKDLKDDALISNRLKLSE